MPPDVVCPHPSVGDEGAFIIIVSASFSGSSKSANMISARVWIAAQYASSFSGGTGTKAIVISLVHFFVISRLQAYPLLEIVKMVIKQASQIDFCFQSEGDHRPESIDLHKSSWFSFSHIGFLFFLVWIFFRVITPAL